MVKHTQKNLLAAVNEFFLMCLTILWVKMAIGRVKVIILTVGHFALNKI